MVKGEVKQEGEMEYLGKTFRIWNMGYIGMKKFVKPVNNNAGTIHETTKEKRKINELIMKDFLSPKMKVLDAYAGFGLTTYLWLQSGAKVLACEDNYDNCSLLIENLDEYLGKRQLRVMNNDNIEVMKGLIDRGEKFDLIDLDPFTNCQYQIPYALRLIDNGILLVTSGEPSILWRKFHADDYLKRYGYEVKKYFNNWEFWKFPKDFLFDKYMKRHTDKKLELIHYFLSRIIGRLIIKVGNPKIDDKLIKSLAKLQNIFGDVKIWEGQKQVNL